MQPTYQQTQYYSAYISADGDIIGQPYGAYGSNGQPTKLGVSLAAYANLEQENKYLNETCTNYYQKLVELGVFQKIKTHDEIMQEQGELIARQGALLEGLIKKLEDVEAIKKTDTIKEKAVEPSKDI